MKYFYLMAMSSSLSSMSRTGRPVLAAATATTAERGTERDSLPPNPPPIRLTVTTTCTILQSCEELSYI